MPAMEVQSHKIRRGPASMTSEQGLLTCCVAQVIAANPMHLAGLDGPSAVAGVGTDFGMARRCATQRACEIYAASLVDRRLLLRDTTSAPRALPQICGGDLS